MDYASFMSVMGASLPVRRKQRELVRRSCEFVMVKAESNNEEDEVIHAMSRLPVRYAVKYRKLVIEDMRTRISSIEPHSDPARRP